MDTPLSNDFLLQQLEDLALRLEIGIRYELLSDDEISIQSGGCRLLGRKLIIIDSRLHTGERARILARELGKHDLEDLYILPQVRAFVLVHSLPEGKNLPHR